MVTVWELGRIHCEAGEFAQNATPIAKPLGVHPYELNSPEKSPDTVSSSDHFRECGLGFN